jgi:5-amino-6-(5-phosphoribosylamino)uracil reductase
MRLLFTTSEGPAPGELSEADLREHYRHRQPRDRPVWLRSNFVTSLDGSIQGSDGRSGSLNTPSDQHVFALHRAHADVILVGAQTVRTEGYRAVDLQPWQRDVRAAAGLADFPVLAVVTGTLDLDPAVSRHGDRQVGHVLVLTTAGQQPEAVRSLTDAGVEVVELPGPRVDLVAATERLAERGLTRVLCEGGSRLHRELLAADLVDEMSLTLAPVMVAGHGQRTTVGDDLAHPPRFRLASALHADDGTLFVNYERER